MQVRSPAKLFLVQLYCDTCHSVMENTGPGSVYSCPKCKANVLPDYKYPILIARTEDMGDVVVKEGLEKWPKSK